jgi:hypothetical protein
VLLGLSLDVVPYGLCGSPDGEREELEGEGHGVHCGPGQRVARTTGLCQVIMWCCAIQ